MDLMPSSTLCSWGKWAEPSTDRTDTDTLAALKYLDHGTSCISITLICSETMARCQWRADGSAPMSAGFGVSGGMVYED